MQMTIIPIDKVIGIGGEFLSCDFTADANVHAIQIYDTHAEIEYNDGTPNKIVEGTALTTLIEQYQPIFLTEKQRRIDATPPDQFSVKDTTTNKWVVDITLVKADALNRLNADLHNYIDKYYDPGTQASLQALYAAPQTTAAIKTQIEPVWTWIQSVVAYYYARKAEIEALSAADDIKAYTWDYTQFDAKVPNVTLRQIYGQINAG